MFVNLLLLVFLIFFHLYFAR